MSNVSTHKPAEPAVEGPRPTPGGQTRPVARTRGRSRPQSLMGAVRLVLLQPPHFITQARKFGDLRARVSAQARGLS
jgi:hypothetical protein